MPVRSIKDARTRRLYEEKPDRSISPDLRRMAFRRLQMIEAAVSLFDLKIPPGNRLEALKGGRKGFWSVRVNRQWRIVFRWREGGAEDVEFVDYHEG